MKIFSRFPQSIYTFNVTELRILKHFVVCHVVCISSFGKETSNWKRCRRRHWQLCETSLNKNWFRSFAHFNIRNFPRRWNLSELSWIFPKNLGETSLPVSIGFLCLSRILTRASFMERHRTDSSECHWLHSNDGHDQTAVCIQCQTLSNRGTCP